MDRPDYIKCVSLPANSVFNSETWCGRKADPTEWRFVDVEHAALARKAGSSQLLCPDCKQAIVKALDSEL